MNPQTHNRGAGRSRLVEEIEEILRRRLGWNEIAMSNIMWRYIGVNVNVFLDYGIDPNAWLQTLSNLSINDPYWLGMQEGDMYIRKVDQHIEIELSTTNPVSAILFGMLMKKLATPSIHIAWERKRITYLKVFYHLSLKYWPWYNIDYRIISSFNRDDVLKFIAGLFDSDGTITSYYVKESKGYRLEVRISACKRCVDILTFIKNEVRKKLGIIGDVVVREKDSILQFRYTHAVELVRYTMPYIRHPIRRLRAALYLMYYDKELTIKDYQYLYETLKYSNSVNDPKRYRAVDALTQAAPQTHTHGEASPVKSLRLIIKNRVKTHMKTRTKKLKACGI